MPQYAGYADVQSVADLGFVAWGGHREFQGGAENFKGAQN